MIAAFFNILNKVIIINPSWYRSNEEREKIFGIMISAKVRNDNGSFSLKDKLKQFIFDFLRVEHLGNLLFIGIILDYPYYVLLMYAIINLTEFLRKIYSQIFLLVKEDKKRIRI